jgi:hypothetical protein
VLHNPSAQERGATRPYARTLGAMTAPVVPTPLPNRVGTVALVLAVTVLVLPVVLFIVFTIAASIEGAEGDDLGYAMVGGFFLAAISTAFIAPLAIAALVLGIVAVARRGRRKAHGVVAIVLSALPSLPILGLPGAIDSFW